MVTPQSSITPDMGAVRLNANKNAQRVISPSMVIGLGSHQLPDCPAVGIYVRRLELRGPQEPGFPLHGHPGSYPWGNPPGRPVHTHDSSSPHFSILRDMRPWITECVPELRYLSLSREGALGTFANAGVAARYNYNEIRGHLDSTIEEICPYYEGTTYLRVHIVAFSGGGTVGALPVLLAALSEVRGTGL